MSNIIAKGMLKGEVANNGSLSGVVNIGGGMVPTTYDGEYEVTPGFSQQVLKTKQKLLEKDVTVQQIPYFEVSNESGGTTVYIGKETEINYG